VLTNAVYFKGVWTAPFTESWTNPEAFTAGDGTKKQVPMMHQREFFRYAQVGDLQALELPYEGNELSMLVLLPRAGAPDPWAGFSWDKLQQVRAQMKTTEVVVSLPKFKLDERILLPRTLSKMGIRDAFNRNADFSGMTGKKYLFISAVVHEAVIDVNEKGTEATGATLAVAKPGVMLDGEEPPISAPIIPSCTWSSTNRRIRFSSWAGCRIRRRRTAGRARCSGFIEPTNPGLTSWVIVVPPWRAGSFSYPVPVRFGRFVNCCVSRVARSGGTAGPSARAEALGRDDNVEMEEARS